MPITDYYYYCHWGTSSILYVMDVTITDCVIDISAVCLSRLIISFDGQKSTKSIKMYKKCLHQAVHTQWSSNKLLI